jgi:hypothetical protein
MKKYSLILLVVLIIGAVLFLLFYKKVEAPEIINEPAVEVKTKDLTFSTSTKEIVKDEYEVDFDFPVTGELRIDTEIIKTVDDLVDSFEKEAQSFSPHPSLSERKYTLANNFESHFGEKYDTFVFLISVDFGGAHPNHFYKTLTFDKQQNIVSLEDFLNEEFNGIESINVISKITKDYFYEKLGESVNSDMINDGASADLKNYKNFYVSSNEIVFLFEPYAVAPYAYSTQEVRIDFSEIKN